MESAARRGVPIVGDIELFVQALPAIAVAKVLAITGSNGKSTVTEMAGAMCRKAGQRTVVAGNIGLPVLDVLLGIERSTVAGECSTRGRCLRCGCSSCPAFSSTPPIR